MPPKKSKKEEEPDGSKIVNWYEKIPKELLDHLTLIFICINLKSHSVCVL